MIAANESTDDGSAEKGSTQATGSPAKRHVLRVDHSERHATLLDLARTCADFDVRMERLDVGDYCIDGRVVIERKTYADFATSLADGRLFPQAAALARSPHRPIVLLEGPKPATMPDVHRHALQGAMISLAVMWRLPVLYARDPEDSLRVLRFVAHQIRSSDSTILRRYDRKPKRLASRKLYMLQGLPGVVRHRQVGYSCSLAPSSGLSPPMTTR
jgi:DNA excision repair protein ERCC-4